MKEVTAESILNLNKKHQTTLMDIMLKYVKYEDKKTYSSFDPELLEALQQQLKERETERQQALEYISKLEQENKLLLADNTTLDDKVDSLTKEKQLLREELIKRTGAHDSNIEVHSSKEIELENEISYLTTQLNAANINLELQIKTNEGEQKKLKDKLEQAEQSLVKLQQLERQVAQQKIQIEELQGKRNQRKDLDNNVDLNTMKLQEKETKIKALSDECKKLKTELYLIRNDHKEALDKLKSLQEKFKAAEESSVVAQGKEKYWKNKATQLEEDIKALREKSEMFSGSMNEPSLEAQQLEMTYIEKIKSLEERIKELDKGSDAKLLAKVGELEGKLEVETSSKQKIEQQLAEISKRCEDIQKNYEETAKELEKHKLSNNVNTSKEYAKIKKDRDVLLEMVSNTKDIANRFENLKKEYDKLLTDNKEKKETTEAAIKEKASLEKLIKEYIKKNTELERKLIRLDEKIALYQEKEKTNENLIKDLLHGVILTNNK